MPLVCVSLHEAALALGHGVYKNVLIEAAVLWKHVGRVP